MNTDHTKGDMELNLKTLIQRLLWRKFYIIGFAGFSAIFAALTLFLLTNISLLPITFYIQLEEVSENYPSGAKFSPSDLKSNAVRKELARRFNIPNDQTLNESLSITQSSLVTDSIIQKHHKRLSVRGLTSGQIDQINEEFKEEIYIDSRNTLKISFDYGAIGISQQEANLFVEAIPRVWSEVYSSFFRTLENSNILSPSELNLDQDSLRSFDMLVVFQKMQSLIRSVTYLRSDERFKLIKTSADRSLSEFTDLITNVVDYGLVPTIGSAQSGTRETLSTMMYVEINRLSDEINGMNYNIETLAGMMSSSESLGEIRGKSSPSVVSGDVFQGVMTLTNKVEFSETLVRLLEKRQVLHNQLSVQQAIAEKFDLLAKTSSLLSREELMNSLKQISAEYESVFHKVVNLQKDGNSYLGYQVLGAPVKTKNAFQQRGLMIIFSVFMLGLMLSFAWALFAQHPKDQKSDVPLSEA
ncbi:MAG: hypothetical protein VW307_03290 [Alphaproteobacteria bacterium]